ncbi:hypothetical protein Droror1_Dr00022122 [Drosera rotundifolia]
MAVSIFRAKRTMPFDERVRHRILSCHSSSSHASAYSDHIDIDGFSPCSSLSQLVHNFLEYETAAASAAPNTPHHDSDSDAEAEITRHDWRGVVETVINPSITCNADCFRNDLLAHVSRAAEIFSTLRPTNKAVLNRNVVAYLREIGYDAGICTTRWTASAGGGLAAGDYEFIDVIHPIGKNRRSQVRYIVDADFDSEFEIARETEAYTELRGALPKVFTGRAEDLKRVLRAMCDEARRSMKSKGMSLPPWRKRRYMIAKWFGPCRRTTEDDGRLQKAVGAVEIRAVVGAQCRSVGFNVAAVDGGGLFCPSVTRTR